MSRDGKDRGRVDHALGHLLLRGIGQYAELHARLSQTLDGGRRFVERFAVEALTVEERASMARVLYGQRDQYGPPRLFPWEDEWYRAVLPPSPATILLGGCGSGREVAALLDRGYQVDAAEPAPALFHSAVELLGGRARVWPLSYEDWVERSRTAELSAELFARGPFDAVILGWGSLCHVLDDELRDRLFQKLCESCPRGPILLSYFSASEAPPARGDRAREWGRSLGRVLGQRRGISPPGHHERLLPHVGFVRTYQRAELVELALSLGRVAQFGDAAHGSPHCTFMLAP